MGASEGLIGAIVGTANVELVNETVGASVLKFVELIVVDDDGTSETEKKGSVDGGTVG